MRIPKRVTASSLTGLAFGSLPEHDVESSRQFSDGRSLDRRKINGHGVTLLGISNPFPNTVLRIAGMPLDVALRRELIGARNV